VNDDTLYRYAGSAAEDLLVAQLWAQMQRDGTLLAAFNDEDFTLGDLIDLFSAPNTMFYKVDKSGIWFVVWLSPVMGGAFLSTYLRPDYRGEIAGHDARETYHSAAREIMEQAFGSYRVLLVVTQQEWLLPNIKRLGYTVLGKIPFLFYGNDAWVGYMTPESLRERMHGRSSREDRDLGAA